MTNPSYYDLYCEEVEKNEKLNKELKHLKSHNFSLTQRLDYFEKYSEDIIEHKVKQQVDKITSAFNDKVISLEKEVTHLNSILNNDGTNSSISTSMTPINKNIRIPNYRVPSCKKKGGQLNHLKHKLNRFNDDDISDVHDEVINICPQCSSSMNQTGHIVYKDELDFQIFVKKIRHRFIETVCPKCGYIS